jgi:hypothetical protein
MSRIVKLEIANVKRIQYALVEPSGNVIVVGGANGEGKSSLLDAIQYIYGGKDSIPPRPLRQGAEKGFAEATEDNGVVTRRTFTQAGGGSLTVKGPDGAAVTGGPQAACDRKRAQIHFDPLAFSRMKGPKQLETTKQLVGLDFSTLDAQRQALYDERTIIGREEKSLSAQAQALSRVPDAPDQEVSVTALMAELTAAEEANGACEQWDKDAKTNRDSMDYWKDEIAKLEESLRRAQDELFKLQKSDAERTPRPDEIDTAPIRSKIENAEGINAGVRNNAKLDSLLAQVAEKHEEYESHTRLIEGIDKNKADQLEAATFPVPGLSFDESAVLYNGLPLEQASQAELLRVSVAMGIALAPDPAQLQVMLVRDGSLLDDNSKLALAKMAADANVQLWLEVVSESADIVIQDGEVKQ